MPYKKNGFQIKFPRFFINKCPPGPLFRTRAKMEIDVKISEHVPRAETAEKEGRSRKAVFAIYLE